MRRFYHFELKHSLAKVVYPGQSLAKKKSWPQISQDSLILASLVKIANLAQFTKDGLYCAVQQKLLSGAKFNKDDSLRAVKFYFSIRFFYSYHNLDAVERQTKYAGKGDSLNKVIFI